ncbi:hypothetical protein BU15DRAFT_46233, partial [Melanogaster broomeanus]
MVKVDSSRGYPLWAPEPASNLPEDYHRTGLKIGDVGVVTEDGGFDVLFNISLPENHPLHQPSGVPSNFRQVILDRSDIRGFPSFDDEGLVLATQTVRQTTQTLSGSISGNATGAGKEDLVRVLQFRDLALENAESWYHFAYCHLGRAEISNDSLYLITGYHKASSWSLASFSQADRDTALSFSLTAG